MKQCLFNGCRGTPANLCMTSLTCTMYITVIYPFVAARSIINRFGIQSTRTQGQLVPKLSHTHGQLVPKSCRTQGQLIPKYNKIHKIHERVHY